MEDFVGFLVVMGIITTILVFVIIRVTSSSTRRNQVYRDLAQRFGGSYSRGGIFHSPSVHFRYGASEVRLLRRKLRTGTMMVVTMDWPDARVTCEVYSRAMNQPASFPKLPFVGLGDPDFDAYFAIRCEDVEQAQQFLAEGVRWHLNKLWHFFGQTNLHVTVHRGRLQIGKRGFIYRLTDLEELLRLTLEMYDQAMLSRSVGIEFTGNDMAQIVEDVACQICGELIGDDMVFCRRCKTPHHLDCWQYTGVCSIYGCAETRYAFPVVARHAPAPEPDPVPELEPVPEPDPVAEPEPVPEPGPVPELEPVETAAEVGHGLDEADGGRVELDESIESETVETPPTTDPVVTTDTDSAPAESNVTALESPLPTDGSSDDENEAPDPAENRALD